MKKLYVFHIQKIDGQLRYHDTLEKDVEDDCDTVKGFELNRINVMIRHDEEIETITIFSSNEDAIANYINGMRLQIMMDTKWEEVFSKAKKQEFHDKSIELGSKYVQTNIELGENNGI